MRIAGLEADDAAVRLQLLIEAGMRVVPVDAVLAAQAGELRARHYRRGMSDVSLADCTALATSLSVDGPLATSDPALAEAARAEGCEVVALPDGRGGRP